MTYLLKQSIFVHLRLTKQKGGCTFFETLVLKPFSSEKERERERESRRVCVCMSERDNNTLISISLLES